MCTMYALDIKVKIGPYGKQEINVIIKALITVYLSWRKIKRGMASYFLINF